MIERFESHSRYFSLHIRYWNALLDLLWPRFQHLVDLNGQSIRDTDPQKLGSIDVRPHYVCCYSYNFFLNFRTLSNFHTMMLSITQYSSFHGCRLFCLHVCLSCLFINFCRKLVLPSKSWTAQKINIQC